MLELIPEGLPAFTATILLDSVTGSELCQLDLKRLHDRLRKRLGRAGFVAAIGGTEAAYKAGSDRWIIHVHLLVANELNEGRARLREAFADVDLFRPVICRPLRDRAAQISYLQKFSTYHRPGRALFAGSGQAYPLKSAQIVQLGKLTAGYRFEDFLFLLGFRRRGPRLVPEPYVQDLLMTAANANQHRRGDDGDDGDVLFRGVANALHASRRCSVTSVTSSPPNSNHLYRTPDSNYAIHEDKRRAGLKTTENTPRRVIARPSPKPIR